MPPDFPHLIVWYVVNIAAALVRQFVVYGSVIVVTGEATTLIRVLPVFLLGASVSRLLIRRRWALALFVAAADLYFVYNRLTIFSSKPLAVAELVGNLGLIGLAVLLTLPQRPDRPRQPKRSLPT